MCTTHGTMEDALLYQGTSKSFLPMYHYMQSDLADCYRQNLNRRDSKKKSSCKDSERTWTLQKSRADMWHICMSSKFYVLS